MVDANFHGEFAALISELEKVLEKLDRLGADYAAIHLSACIDNLKAMQLD